MSEWGPEMVKVKSSEYPVGAWFVVQLLDDEHFVLGLIIARPKRNVVEAAYFGPYDRRPTLNDAEILTPNDVFQLSDGITSYQFRHNNLRTGKFAVLGVSEQVDTSDWFEPRGDGSLVTFYGHEGDLTRAMVAGWTGVTDPNRLSSWFFGEPGQEWLTSLSEGDGVEFLDEIFAELGGSGSVDVRESKVGFGAVELAARLVVIGRWKYGRMVELSELEHGVGYPEGRLAGQWASRVPEVQQRDRESMARLARKALQTIDVLLERSVWVEELRVGDAVVWAAFEKRVGVLREWLTAEWVLPKTWEQTLGGIMGSFEEDLVADDDSDFNESDRFVPRPVDAGVDATARLAAMSWFDLDEVSDWSATELQSGGLDAVRVALDAALVDGSGDRLSGAVGLAAADVVARLVSQNDSGHGPQLIGGLVEQRVFDWVEANLMVDVDGELVVQAKAVVGLMLRGEMAEEIDDFDDESRAAWAALLGSITTRLDVSPD